MAAKREESSKRLIIDEGEGPPVIPIKVVGDPDPIPPLIPITKKPLIRQDEARPS